jgi:hypothetical protein
MTRAERIEAAARAIVEGNIGLIKERDRLVKDLEEALQAEKTPFDQLCADITRLAPYVQHKPFCDVAVPRATGSGKCNCGLEVNRQK